MRKLEPKLNDSAAVRAELEALYFSAKLGSMPAGLATQCAGILKAIGVLLREEKEFDIEAQLNELREAINQLKGE